MTSNENARVLFVSVFKRLCFLLLVLSTCWAIHLFLRSRNRAHAATNN